MDISKFGTQYSGAYARPNLFVVNMENGDILYETSGEAFGAMNINVWVFPDIRRPLILYK